jgi:hypothetical protein
VSGISTVGMMGNISSLLDETVYEQRTRINLVVCSRYSYTQGKYGNYFIRTMCMRVRRVSFFFAEFNPRMEDQLVRLGHE